MLEPHRLMILRSVISTGSVHGAAKSLHLAPSTVSQHLRVLSRQTGLLLFEKVGRGIEATPAARRLAEDSAPVLADLEHLERTVADLRNGRVERIAFACFTSVAQMWMPYVVTVLQAIAPTALVEIGTGELQRGEGRERQADVDIRSEALDAKLIHLSGYQRHVLVEEELCLVLPAKHALSSRKVVDIVELREQAWIESDINDVATGRIIARACMASGFTPRYVARLDDHRAAVSLTGAGLGLTVLPRIALSDLPDSVTVRSLSSPTVGHRIVAHVREHPDQNLLISAALNALHEATKLIP